MADVTTTQTDWSSWEVAPSSGFEVSGATGTIGLRQISATDFLVGETFRFSNPHFEDDIVRLIERDGTDAASARARVDAAREYIPMDNPTDLASIPPFMRWFENTYGPHTLAAILHDELIVDAPNEGALKSDTLSDRFFRHMLDASGVPWLKRWIIWAAVALRTRWAAGGWRQLSLIGWVVAAVVGIGSFFAAIVLLVADGATSTTSWVLLAVAAALPFLSAPLWGSQRGASLVAAIAGVFVIPAALFVVVGSLVYGAFERLARAAGRT